MGDVPTRQSTARSKWMFPWWCVFIAYGLSAIVATVSIFFIVVRGIEFGDTKIRKWLTSLLSSFFASVILIQPIKVSAGEIRNACRAFI